MSHVQRAKTDFCGRLLPYLQSQDLVLWNSHDLHKNRASIDMRAWCGIGDTCVWIHAALNSDTSVDSWSVLSLSCNKHCASRQSEFRLSLGCWTLMARITHGAFSDCWRNIAVCPRQVAPYKVNDCCPDNCMVCWEDCCDLLCDQRDCAGQLKDFVVFAYARWILQDVVCADILGQVSLAMITVLQDGFDKIDKDRLTHSS